MLRLVTYIGGIVLGIFFIFFGLNGFFQFITISTFEGDSVLFMEGVSKSQYFFPMLYGLKLFSGLSILLNKYKRLGLIILAPILVNILLFHIFLMPLVTTIIPLCLFILWSIQLFDEKRFFSLLFKSY